MSVAVTIMPSRDAAQLAALHAACFERPWSQDSFAQSLAGPGVVALVAAEATQAVGFMMLQILPPSVDGPADERQEAEILTLGVRPSAQGRGVAKQLIWHAVAQFSLAAMRLDVAADNRPALALYRACGFRETGRRADYYKKADGRRRDAVLMHAVFSHPMC